jgi:branched-chain amino acid transport system substrate-binding protein
MLARLWRLGVCAFILSVVSVAQNTRAEAPPLTIGVILPLSGSAASFGETSRAAIELALDNLPPEDKRRVKVIYEDDGLVPSRSVTAGRKLLTIDNVDVLLSWSSSTALSLVGITEAQKIPHVGIASDPQVAKGRSYAFTYWALPEDEARTLYEYLVARGIKRVALLSVSHNGLLAVRDAFVALAAKRGDIEIVGNEEVAPDVQDFRGVLERFRSREPLDAFIPIFFPGQLAVAVKQARGVGIKAPLFGFETFEDKDDIKAAAGLFSGVIYATGADPTKDFVDAFEAKHPGMSYYTGSNCYDAIHLFAKASREKKDGDTIASFLRSLRDYPTASGRISATSDNRFSLPTVLKTINEKGKVVRLAK